MISRVADGASPLNYVITNDLIYGEIRAYFNAQDVCSVSCVYNDTFDTSSRNDYIFSFASDGGLMQLTQFDVDISCQTTTS